MGSCGVGSWVKVSFNDDEIGGLVGDVNNYWRLIEGWVGYMVDGDGRVGVCNGGGSVEDLGGCLSISGGLVVVVVEVG